MPDEWRIRDTGGALVERVTLDEASGSLPFALALPEALPAGFALASLELVWVKDEPSVTVFFRDAEVDAGGGAIRLHVELATALPPVSSAEQFPVRLGEADGRWTPARAQLEWVDGGIYRSLDAPGLRLEDLLAMASSIPAVEGP
jgi:hypothetical protein